MKRVELCSWIRVAGLARDCNSQGWEILVQLRDPDGLVHEELIPYSELAGDGTTAYARLKSRGLRSMGGKGVKNAILSCLEMWETPVRIRMVPTAGHHDGRFVTPSKVYGPTDGDELRLDRRNLRPGQMTEYKGTKELADELASLCVGNSRLVLALSTAFVGPLLHLLGIEGGGLHFQGESSIGKTTLVKIAKTPYGYSLQTWRGTDNGLEGVAANHSDLLLVLDEIGESDGRVAGRVVYMLANGTGKLRADARGEARTPKTWRLVFLSTGEKTLAEMMAEAGQTIKAGQEIRMIEIAADAGAGMGIFEDIHGFPSPAAFADHLVALSDKVAGVAGDEYLTKLMADVDSAVATVKTHMDSFMATYCPAGAVGQVSRVYRRMALIAAAGELATSIGVLPWSKGEATAAAAYCASNWVDRRGGVGSSEAMRCIESVLSQIERYGSSRFDEWTQAPLSTDEMIVDKAHIRYGWRRMQNGRWEYYATADGWAQLHEGFSKDLANKALIDAGILKPGNDRTPKPVTVPGYKKQRLYHIVPPSEDDADA
ncbi:DUF927 domain-containing protein [Caenispirillum bisanense]|uniref:DUF927 domain-containing protein n=1 Tax=Caenispirillum bisanense TaxID=414052 RepID=UPI001596A092|nr:DUF927 domain-containing protein [Caenispirillum bisanense]